MSKRLFQNIIINFKLGARSNWGVQEVIVHIESGEICWASDLEIVSLFNS